MSVIHSSEVQSKNMSHWNKIIQQPITSLIESKKLFRNMKG